MMARCGICLKTISNKKEPLCLVTIDGEAKLQFGYYSYHKADLNRSLVGTKVHVTCYKRYWDKWYNTCVRNVKDIDPSSGSEHGITPINNENTTSDRCSLSNFENVEKCNDDEEINKDPDETCDLLCSRTTLMNHAAIRKNRSTLSNLSNVDYSMCSRISAIEANKIVAAPDSLFDETNNESSDIHTNSSIESNSNNCQYEQIYPENQMVTNGFLFHLHWLFIFRSIMLLSLWEICPWIVKLIWLKVQLNADQA